MQQLLALDGPLYSSNLYYIELLRKIHNPNAAIQDVKWQDQLLQSDSRTIPRTIY